MASVTAVYASSQRSQQLSDCLEMANTYSSHKRLLNAYMGWAQCQAEMNWKPRALASGSLHSSGEADSKQAHKETQALEF